MIARVLGARGEGRTSRRRIVRPVRYFDVSFGRALPFVIAAIAVACAASPSEPRAPTRGEPAAVEGQRDVARGEPAREAARPPAERTVAIGGSGDILIHIKVARSATEFAGEGGYERVFGELREVITEDEIAFANLETPLSLRVPPESADPPVLGAPGEAAQGLARAGIDLLSVANNHAYDQTAPGMSDTIEAVRAANVASVGAASDVERAPGPIVIERNGLRVAFVAFTERINRGPQMQNQNLFVARFDEARALAKLAEARAMADIVVLSIHWSHDYVVEPLIPHRRLARVLVDGGADLILGHGPHVLQDVERFESPRGEAVVAYSLGNLVSNQGLLYRAGHPPPEGAHRAAVLPGTRDGVWLRTRFALEGDRIVVRAIEGVPLWTHNNHLAIANEWETRLDIRVRPLRAIEPVLQAERRAAIARALGDQVTLLE